MGKRLVLGLIIGLLLIATVIIGYILFGESIDPPPTCEEECAGLTTASINNNSVCVNHSMVVSGICEGSCEWDPNYGCYYVEETAKPCDNIDWEPLELTFELSYCQGDECTIVCDENGENCHNITTKEECESVDVIAGNDVSQWGQDGIPDCEWIEGLEPIDACKPNK